MVKEAHHLSRQQKMAVVERHREHIRQHVASLSEVQRELKEAVGNKPLLVVDATLRIPAERLQKRLDELRSHGWEELVALYVEQLFGERISHSAEDVFQRFFGEDINLQFLDIRSGTAKTADTPGAVIFSGSPISIAEAMQDGESLFDDTFTHRELWRRTNELYREAVRQEIPAIGICYGHQMIARYHGGKIRELPESQKGLVHLEPADEYARELLVGVAGSKLPAAGKVMVGHGEIVKRPDRKRSALLFRTSDKEQLVHGLLHIIDADFSGDAQSDTELVNELLAGGRHVAMGVQGHPEADAMRNILFDLAINEDDFAHTETMLTATMLQCMTSFLKKHAAVRA